jgi:predicted phosphodiesterase
MKKIKILFIADQPSRALWDFFDKSRLEGIDLIISCGDLPPLYLSFLATFFTGPVLYIHGNHDDCYVQTPPEGCICIDDKVYNFHGIRIAGLGGSMRYHRGTFQYTEGEMFRRTLKLQARILKHRGIDILISHAPAKGLNDGSDLPHMGFQSFHRLLKMYKPKYFVHGHMHLSYDYKLSRTTNYPDTATTVINAFERYVLEYPVEEASTISDDDAASDDTAMTKEDVAPVSF